MPNRGYKHPLDCQHCVVAKQRRETTCGHEPHYGNGLCRPCASAQYYQDHRETVLEQTLERRLADPEKKRRQSRRYYVHNREEIIARRKQRWRDNPERRRAEIHKTNKARRARKAGAVVDADLDFNAIFWRDGGRCQLCQTPVKPGDVSFDHIVPLSAGGDHTAVNLQLAHLTCNKRRWATGPAQMRLIG